MLSILLKRPRQTRFLPIGTDLDEIKGYVQAGFGGSVEEFSENLFGTEKSGIITVDATLTENHTTSVTVSDYPVEDGATFSDHFIVNPDTYTMTGIISDTPLDIGAFSFVANGVSTITTFDENSVSRSIVNYRDIEKLQKSGEPFTIISSLKIYENCIMTNFRVSRDKNTSNEIRFSCDIRVIQYGTTETVKLAKEKKKDGKPDAAKQNKNKGNKNGNKPKPDDSNTKKVKTAVAKKLSNSVGGR